MTTNQTLQTMTAGEERSRYEDPYPHTTQRPAPRLVLFPPAPREAREAATIPDRKHPAMVDGFAWTLLDRFKDSFELWAAGSSRPLARLTVAGLALPSATVDADEYRLLFSTEGVGNRRVAVTDADSRMMVADFEWRRLGRDGTLRLVDGGQLKWHKTSRWRASFTFADRFANLLLRFHPDGHALGYGLDAQLEPSVGPRGDLVLLLALGWFLLLSSGAAARPQPVVAGVPQKPRTPDRG